jgi:CheY-like chemotaxis protein
VLHELATNARKYGALSVPEGHLSIRWNVDIGAGRLLLLKWQESGVPNVKAPDSRGFGSTLIERSLEANDGKAVFHFGANGMSCEINLPLPQEALQGTGHVDVDILAPKEFSKGRRSIKAHLKGKRILLVEDEPLIVMEMVEELTSHGLEIIGPANNVHSATRLIAENAIDAALIDANLNGSSVVEVAAALAQKGVPFAFATGYGREGVPEPFRDAAILAKPFNPDGLIGMVSQLLSGRPSNILTMRPKSY